MATKKSSTPVLENPVDEEMLEEEKRDDAQQLANMKAELAALKKENERLKLNNISAASDAGSMSDYERVQEACKRAVETGEDPWKIKISVRAPRRPKKEDPYYWVSVNTKSIQIPANDKYFELALPYAETLVNMIEAENFANDFIDSIEDYDPVTNPHKDEMPT